jgi:hypothetical protein
MENTYHRGYRVRVRSSLNGSRWKAEVSVAELRTTPRVETALPSPGSAATEEEADLYGLAIARTWIANSSN